MGLEFKTKPGQSDADKTWTAILTYICAKKTSDPDFKKLFNEVLADENHPYNREARTLKMLYDFTPLHSTLQPK